MNFLSKRIATTLTGVLLMCASSGVASAQTVAEQEAADRPIQIFSAATVTTTGAVIIYGAFLVNERQMELEQKVDIMKQFVMIDAYMNENGQAMSLALSVGAGDELDDIATLLGYAGRLEREQLAGLRASRGELMAALGAREEGSLESARRVHEIFSSVLRGTSHEEVER